MLWEILLGTEMNHFSIYKNPVRSYYKRTCKGIMMHQKGVVIALGSVEEILTFSKNRSLAADIALRVSPLSHYGWGLSSWTPLQPQPKFFPRLLLGLFISFCGWFAFIYVCPPHVCLMLILLFWAKRIGSLELKWQMVWAAKWVLGTKPRSSMRAMGICNPWVFVSLFPTPTLLDVKFLAAGLVGAHIQMRRGHSILTAFG